MATGDDMIKSLREALKHSPDNLPLRLHLGESLMGLGRYEEAEWEYKAAIEAAPHDARCKLGLADAYFKGGKGSPAMVVVEELIKLPNPPARTYLLYSKLLFKSGDVDRAVRQYKRAIEADEELADGTYAGQLGIHGSAAEEAESDVVDGRMRASGAGGSDGDPSIPIERPKITFADVGGMDTLKDEIRMKIIHPLAHPELYKAYGKTIGGGILMYGPPGCGKTHLARATAGEIKAGFVSVGINDVLDMWIGNSERNLHEIFDRARRSRPCVLFFDEVDALAASRTDMRHSGGRHQINQFLAEMDGVAASNDGLLILAATNAPWHVDPAFRRPGRFDRILFIPPPDATARAGILQLLLTGKPVQDIDHDQIAKKTDGFSGADLKAVVDMAIESKLREAMRDGIPKPMTTRDLTSAAAQVRPSTREWFNTAKNYALYSNQGGVYDDILKYMKL
ncbi:ATP-binding protein [Humisphaera borealis]|uniref:AAA family ATPase n=1 Tax=Humisphaera borealis TaxID=2807512 RepID=A0A7M2WS66_9BACT|nr:ATP-binding protein [Humisphaera borealis]QOV88375.1 AAA family ATPase [Humisphaera borealis]